jgi:hypothetical protein
MMLSTLTALAALITALAALIIAARIRATTTLDAPAVGGRMKLSVGLHYSAGVSGTYTVPANAYATGITCHATTVGSLSINSGDAIPIPAGAAFSMSPPLLGTNFQLGPGSTIVFTGTDSYVVVLE